MSGQVPEVKKGVSHKEELENFLKKYCNPAFGTLTKKEIDLLVFEMMINLDILTDDMYKNQLELKITSSKIRNLYYDIDLRKADEKILDNLTIELLKKPLVLKSGKEFKLEIEKPLLKDHIKSKIKQLGYLTDGSFSVDIITLTDKAYFALIENLIKEEFQKKYKEQLIEAGAIDPSIPGLLKYASKHILRKYASDAAVELIEQSENDFKKVISAIFDSKNINTLKSCIPDYFK
jgi:hypothetical protein